MKAKTASGTKSRRRGRKWSRDVKTDSTHPPPGLFTKDAQTIAKTMATKKVSPRGLGSGIRMIQLFINRAGKNLTAARRQVLERAKRILQERRKNSRRSKDRTHTSPHRNES